MRLRNSRNFQVLIVRLSLIINTTFYITKLIEKWLNWVLWVQDQFSQSFDIDVWWPSFRFLFPKNHLRVLSGLIWSKISWKYCWGINYIKRLNLRNTTYQSNRIFAKFLVDSHIVIQRNKVAESRVSKIINRLCKVTPFWHSLYLICGFWDRLKNVIKNFAFKVEPWLNVTYEYMYVHSCF